MAARVWDDPAVLSATGGRVVFDTDLARGATKSRLFRWFSHGNGIDPHEGHEGPNLVVPGRPSHIALLVWRAGDYTSAPPMVLASTTPPRGAGKLTAATTRSAGPGGTATVTGRLTWTDGKTGIVNRPVVLQARRAGTAEWRDVRAVPRNRRQRAREPEDLAQHRVPLGAPGGAVGAAVASAKVTTNVRPQLVISAPAEVATGRTFTVSGSVLPVARGRDVHLQRRVAGVWRTVATAEVGGDGKVTFRQVADGTALYRLRIPAGAALASAVSATRRVSVG